MSRGSKETSGRSSGNEIFTGLSLSLSSRRLSTAPTISSTGCHSFFTFMVPASKPRHVKNVPYELVQMLGLLINSLEQLLTLVSPESDIALQQGRYGARNRCQRRTQVVRD